MLPGSPPRSRRSAITPGLLWSAAARRGVVPSGCRALTRLGSVASIRLRAASSPRLTAPKNSSTSAGGASVGARRGAASESRCARSFRQLAKPCSLATASCTSASWAEGFARCKSWSRSLASLFRYSRLGRSGRGIAHHPSLCQCLRCPAEGGDVGSLGRWVRPFTRTVGRLDGSPRVYFGTAPSQAFGLARGGEEQHGWILPPRVLRSGGSVTHLHPFHRSLAPPVAQKGPAARRRLSASREAYSLYVERAAEGANEADGPFWATG